MAFSSRSGQSLDGAFPVPLKSIDSEEDGDLEFPRLGDVPYEAEDSSKFLIKLLNDPRGKSFLEVSGSDTVAEVKEQAIRSVKHRGLVELESAGIVLKNEKTLSECGIVPGTELFVLWPPMVAGMEQEEEEEEEEDDDDTKSSSESTEELAPRGADITFEAEKRDLMNKARARILYHWDGYTPDRQMLGLPLHPQEFVMIGRVVNQDWFEGYLPSDLNKHGFIPRNYVKIESVYDPSFAQTLGFPSQELPVSAPVPDSPQPHRRRPVFWAIITERVGSLFSRKTPKKTQKIATAADIMPDTPAPRVPPSPFPPKPPVPSLDLLEHGNRLRISFRLEKHNLNDYPTVTATLSLVSAPQTRIAHVTVELQFEHDVVVELEPKREETGETEVYHSNSVTNDISLKGGVTQGPVGANLKVGHTMSKAVEFSRRTRGTIVGDGEGTSIAYWVLKEDPGEAGRFGLDSQQKMWVKLHVRPVRVDYQVNAKIVTDDGGIGGWFGAKRLTSGRQRFYFRS